MPCGLLLLGLALDLLDLLLDPGSQDRSRSRAEAPRNLLPSRYPRSFPVLPDTAATAPPSNRPL
eukprot:11628645-Alexandrium_andersonii.AAC.1